MKWHSYFQCNQCHTFTIFSATNVTPLLFSVQPMSHHHYFQCNQWHTITIFSATNGTPLLFSVQPMSHHYYFQCNRWHTITIFSATNGTPSKLYTTAKKEVKIETRRSYKTKPFAVSKTKCAGACWQVDWPPVPEWWRQSSSRTSAKGPGTQEVSK